MTKPIAYPTAEEVCEVIELMALIGDDADENPFASLCYRMTHCREAQKRCGNAHEDWVAEFRQQQEYWRNANKPPSDPTKGQVAK